MVKFKVNILKKDLLLTPFHLTYHKYKYLNCILQLSLYICQGNIICKGKIEFKNIFLWIKNVKKKTKQSKTKTTTTTKQTSKENQTLTSMILYISNDLTMQNLSQKQFMFFI